METNLTKNSSRSKKIILITGLAIAAMMIGSVLKQKDATDTLRKRSKKYQVFPERQISSKPQEPLTPLNLPTRPTHSSTTHTFDISPKKHMCSLETSENRKANGAYAENKKKVDDMEIDRTKQDRWRTKIMKDYGKFELHDLTYYYGRDKSWCYYFDPSGRPHWSHTAEVKSFNVEVFLGGVKYTCQVKTQKGQRCFLLGTDFRKIYLWTKNIVVPETKVFTFGEQKFTIFLEDKAKFKAYYSENNLKIYLPEAQVKYILSDEKEKSFVIDDITYHYLDSTKEKCWSVFKGRREECYVSSLKEKYSGSFIGIDGIEYFYVDAEKIRASYLNYKGVKKYVIARSMKHYGYFDSRGKTFFYKDMTKKQCFTVSRGRTKVSYPTSRITDYGEFTVGDKTYYFLTERQNQVFTKDKTYGTITKFYVVKSNPKSNEIIAGKIKKIPSIFYFFVGDDMYYYKKNDRTKCVKFGTTEVLNVVDAYKIVDNTFVSPMIFFTMVGGKEVKYKFKDFSREECFAYKEGVPPERFVKFDKVGGDKWFKWGNEFWLYKDKDTLKGFNTKASVEGLTAKVINLMKYVHVKTYYEKSGERLEETRKKNLKLEELRRKNGTS